MRVFVLLALAACGGSGGDVDATTPAIAMIDPPVIATGSDDQTVRIVGTGFQDSAIVLFDGDVREPASASETELGLTVTYGDTLDPAVHRIQVVNPGAGLNASNVVGLDVVIPNGIPRIAALVPPDVIAGGGDLTLTIQGSRFASGAQVTWAGKPTAATLVDDTQIQIAVSASDVAAIGSFPVIVTNPGPGGGTSVPRDFVVRGLADPAGVLARVSVTDAGAEIPFGGQSGFISNDGRYVTFASSSNGVVATDANNNTDVYVRDTCRGAAAGCTPTSIPLSLKPDGTFSSLNVGGESIASGDMRFVGFAGNNQLFPALPSGAIVIRDTCIGAAAGCTPVTFQGTPKARVGEPFDFSDDGRYVAFVSDVSLTPGDTNNAPDVYVFDTCHGAASCTPSSTLVSATPAGAGGNNQSRRPTISANARFVSFGSLASDLVPGDTNGEPDVFVRDTCIGAGASCTPTTLRASVGPMGSGTGGGEAGTTSLDRSGRYVAFTTNRSLTSDDTNTSDDVYVTDTCFGAAGACTPTPFLMSAGMKGAFAAGPRALSLGGRYLAFLALGDLNNFRSDAFVRDTCIGVAGCTPTTHAISVAGATIPDKSTDRRIVLSADGRFATFQTDATNLVTGDTNASFDVFLAATGF
jgi:IPT/TIG domain-containing protein/WD40 repeat protein